MTFSVRARVAAVLVASGVGVAVIAQQQPAPTGYTDTPLQPNGKWRVHDGTRPHPRMIDTGTAPATPAPPPSDAIVLVGTGEDLGAWQMTAGGAAVTWPMKDGVLQSGKGMIRTKDEFSDVQLHVEFATPSQVKGDSQGRGNSGVFFGRFEIQVLDSYNNKTYPDGQASAMYGQFPPLVNASRPPGAWQTYDIVFTAPRFTAAGALEKPAVVTVLHNGVVVHNATPFWGPTTHKAIGKYEPRDAKGPIGLQDHGNPVRFRNVWIRPLKGYDETT
jgi:hypothetical protein